MVTYSDLVVKQGSTFSMTITLEDGQGSVLDLSLFSFVGQMRSSYSSVVAAEFTCTVADPLTGQVTISLTPLQTGVLKAGRYVWDLVALLPSGDVAPIAEGQVEVTPSVTNYFNSSNPDIVAKSFIIGKTVTGMSVLDGLPASYYLDYNNFTNTPTSILDFNITDGLEGQVLTAHNDGTFTFEYATKDADTLGGVAPSYYLDFDNLLNRPTSIFDLGITDGLAGQVLTTNADGTVSFTDVASIVVNQATFGGQGPSFYLDYTNMTNAPSTILDFGISDGGVGDVLTTDGSGNFFFAPAPSPTTLGGQPASYYLDYNNLTNVPTFTTSFFGLTDVVDGVAGSVWTTDGAGHGSFQVPSTDATTLAGQSATYYLEYGNLLNRPTIPTNLSQLGLDAGSHGLAGQHLRSDGDGSYSWEYPDTNAFTLNGKQDSYFLNYNNLLNKPALVTSLLQLSDVAGDGLNGWVLTTNGSGTFSFQPMNSSTGVTDYNLLSNLPNIPASIFDLGITDSSAGYVLTTDGSGNVSFQPQDYTAVTLGGELPSFYLDYNNFVNTPFIPSKLMELTDVINGQGAYGEYLMSDGLGNFSFQPVYTAYNALTFDGKDPAYYLNYANLGNLPTIPTDINQLTDASNLLANSITDINQLADSGNLLWRPSDVSELTDNLGLLVHFSGNYFDLTNRPNVPQDVADLTDNSGLLVHFSGSYNDLTDKPAIPTDVSQLADAFGIISTNDWNTLQNKPIIPTDVNQLTDVSGLLDHFSGNYTDLYNLPTIPTKISDLFSIAEGQNGQVLTALGNGYYEWSWQSMGGGTGPSISTMDFSELNGNLKIDMTDGSSVTTNFDGRYLRSINGITGDQFGNANMVFSRVITGPDSLRTGMSPTEEAIFVVVGNIVDPTQNGKSYAWDKETSTWYPLAGSSSAELDARYVIRESDTLDALLDVDLSTVPVNDQVLTWDAAVGKWIPRDYQADQVLTEYIQVYHQNDQPLVRAGVDIKSDHIINTEGNISYDPSTGVFAVNQKGIYILSAELTFKDFQVDNTWVQVAWVDAQTNSELQLGATSKVFGVTSTGRANSDSRVECIIELDAGKQVKLRCNNGTGTATLEAHYSKSSIRKIAGFLPINGTGSTITPPAITSIDQLTDVQTTGVTDGQFLVWDSTNNVWSPITLTIPTQIQYINELLDVDTTIPANVGQALVWDGANWVPGTVMGAGATVSGSIDSLSDVDTVSFPPSIGNTLNWNGTNWVPGAPSTSLLALTDTDVGSATTGQTLSYDATTSTWVATTPRVTNYLNDLWDVNLDVPPVPGQTLTFLNGEWVPATPVTNINQLTDVDTVTFLPNVGEVLGWNGTNWAPMVITGSGAAPTPVANLDQLTDVDISTIPPLNGQGLVYDAGSSLWRASTIATNLNQLTDVDTVTIPPLDGQVLTWDSNQSLWVSSSLPPDQYVESAQFNVANGQLTLGMKDQTQVTTNLDGRYARTVNAIQPDAVGNVAISLAAVQTGDMLSRPATAPDATIYVVSGDVDPNNDGLSYIYSVADSAWFEIGGVDMAAMDARYVNQNVDTLDALADVDTTTVSPVDGNILAFQSGVWSPSTFTVDKLTDVDTTTTPAADRDVLTWDAGAAQWVPAPTVSLIDELADVDTTTTPAADRDVLTWDASQSQWIPAYSVKSVNDLTDVDTSTATPNDRDALVWDATQSLWVPGTVSAITLIGELADVETTTVPPADGNVLVWNALSSTWVPGTAASLLDQLVDVDTSTATPNDRDALVWDATQSLWVPGVQANSVDDLIDADTTTTPPVENDALVWDSVNTQWVPGIQNKALTELTDVDVTTSAPTDKQALVYDATTSMWVPSTVGGTNTFGNDTFSAMLGQVTFVTAQVPIGGAMLFRNGVMVPAAAVSVATNVVTYDPVMNNGEVMEAGDRVEVAYVYSTVLPPVSQSINVFSDVDTFTVAPVAGDQMVYDGTSWVPSSAIPVPATPVNEGVILPDHGRAWGVFFASGDQLIGGGSSGNRGLGAGRDSAAVISPYPIEPTYAYTGWKKLAVGIANGFALSNEGVLYGIGGNLTKQMGSATTGNYYTAFTPIDWFQQNGWTVLDFWVNDLPHGDSTGFGSTMIATATNGTETKSFGWGYVSATNENQSGNGLTVATHIPTAVVGLSAGEWIIQAHLSSDTTMCVTNNGGVYWTGISWLNNCGDMAARSTVTTRTITWKPSYKRNGSTFANATKVWLSKCHGYTHISLVLDADGHVWTAGAGTEPSGYLLGTGAAEDAQAFADITPAGTIARDIGGGMAQGWFIDTLNNLWLWGKNWNNQWGDGTAVGITQQTPKIAHTNVAKAIFNGKAGGSHRAMQLVKTDGTVSCHGENGNASFGGGPIGYGPHVNPVIPVLPINLTNESVTDIIPIGKPNDSDDMYVGTALLTNKGRILVAGRTAGVPIPSIQGDGTFNRFMEIYNPVQGLRSI